MNIANYVVDFSPFQANQSKTPEELWLGN